MNQEQAILNHLRNVGPLTGSAAYELYGCMRLPARVSDLRSDGWPVCRRFVRAKNRYGKTVNVAEYYMEGNAK